MNRTKLCIFDMGGVLLQGRFDVIIDISRILKLQPDKFLSIAGENLHLLYSGEINSHQFWERFSKNSGLEIQDDLWSRFFQPTSNERVVNLVLKLKKFVKVVAGTNTTESHYWHVKEKGYFDIFDAVHASYKIGFAKPESKFFNYIMESEDCQPMETIFIDDQKENVKAAEELGINAILFRTVEILKKDLSKFFPVPKEPIS